MDSELLLSSLARDSDALADAADAAGPDAPVPTTEGWTVADLVGHLVMGDIWARTIVERRTTERVVPEMPADAPSGAALVPYFRDGARRLLDALAATDPATPVWTFSASDRTAQFWRRRRAHETAIHRFDAQSAAGTQAPIDAALAADGIDELLTVFLPRVAERVAPDGERIHLHCTDVDGEWLIARDGDDVTVTREHAKGDVAARGTASDLVLFVWGRVPADRLEVFGDATALDRLQAALRI